MDAHVKEFGTRNEQGLGRGTHRIPGGGEGSDGGRN